MPISSGLKSMSKSLEQSLKDVASSAGRTTESKPSRISETASGLGNTSSTGLSDGVSLSEEAKRAPSVSSSGVNLAAWDQPTTKPSDAGSKSPTIAKDKPTMTLKKAFRPTEGGKGPTGAQRLAPVPSKPQSPASSTSGSNPDPKPAEEKKPTPNLRSRVSDLHSTSTSLESKTERLAELPGKTDV